MQLATADYVLSVTAGLFRLVHDEHWASDAVTAPELFRVRLDMEPKLRYAPTLGVMLLANTAIVTRHLPLSIVSRFLGDFNKWYPTYRQLPMFAREMAAGSEMVKKAEKLVRLRLSDPPDA